MAKFVSRPAGSLVNIQPAKIQKDPEEFVLATGLIDGGMVTAIPIEQLQNNQLASQKNFYTRYGRITRRAGSLLFEPTKPDSNRVLNFISYAKNDGTVKLIRLTPDSIYAATSGAWTEITPAGSPISGGDDDRFTPVVIDDRLFIANNGADNIQEINTTTNEYDDAGNAPPYKFLTGFGDRLIGANLSGSSPNGLLVGWSGNRNYTEWDPIVDKTAGEEPLVDSSTDDADFISGVFGFANSLEIVRERSIWEATKTGSPTQPFNFYSKIPNIGCDCPYSITRIPAGLAWLDFRTRDVYILGLDGSVNPIGAPIIRTLISQVNDPATVFASYNPRTQEYIICLPASTSTLVQCWVFSFRYKVWYFEEYDSITTIADLDYDSGSLAIGELIGDIGDLVGDIGDLSPDTTTVTRFFGYETGEITYASDNASTDNGLVYTAEADSKMFSVPDEQTLVSRFRFEYTPVSATGSFAIYYKKNNKAWILLKTVSWASEDVGTDQIVTMRKTINARRVQWRVSSISGLFDVTEYEVKQSTEGESVSRDR